MRRAEREVTDRGQLLEIIGRCTCCRVAFSNPEGAYIVPLSFAFVPGQPDRFYFHGAKEGRKASLIAQKPKVGFELDCAYELVAGQSGCKYSCRYQSIVGTGVIGEVQDLEEKKQALSALMRQYEPSRSFAFTDEQAQAVAVYRLDVAAMTGKQRQ